MNKDYKKITRNLTVLWLASYFALSVVSIIRKTKLQLVSNLEIPPVSFDGFFGFILCSLAFYFLPLTLLIKHCAGIAGIRAIVIIAKIFTIFFSAILVVAAIFWIFGFIAT